MLFPQASVELKQLSLELVGLLTCQVWWLQ
ncbi:hypothetical protein SCOCK_1260002 [Actinacidiphila cocklensis]|uniref:Uncharacterized protein n=1 Tax=Actinacidiphila cocklensis TaxID=887465 RepID=A0A9W4E1N0_9ACTN|nr:hypothetical protein SCOCK_1260002 [Actinacidiphila cocklensis]